MSHQPPPDARAIRRTGLVLLAALAMVARVLAAVLPIGAGPAVANVEATAFTVLLGGNICHADGSPASDPANPDDGNHGGSRAHDCVLCPACLGFAAAQADPPVAVAAPARAYSVRFVLPAAGAGPPAFPFSTARPRGPPVAV